MTILVRNTLFVYQEPLFVWPIQTGSCLCVCVSRITLSLKWLMMKEWAYVHETNTRKALADYLRVPSVCFAGDSQCHYVSPYVPTAYWISCFMAEVVEDHSTCSLLHCFVVIVTYRLRIAPPHPGSWAVCCLQVLIWCNFGLAGHPFDVQQSLIFQSCDHSWMFSPKGAVWTEPTIHSV